ncbi:MAG: sugar ABC transporter substrate-binding protein [Sphaerochaeta sp.]|nr:sugar ABC transporter substrate-binding protein [Sphaerochaeta sp.]
MKRSLRIGSVLLVCFALLLSCTVDDGKTKSTTATAVTEVKAVEPANANEPTQKIVKVGFIATNLSAESQARVAKQFKNIGEEKGWDLTILNSQGSIETQATQIDNLVQMKVDAIVLAMGHPSEIKPSISAANKAGIPVITIASGYVDGVVTDITANDFVMGAKITSHLFDTLGGKGNIVAIKFVKNAGCRKRGEVFDAILPEYPEIKLLDEYSVAATARFMDDTTSAMETFVTKYGDEIDGVWCAFDQLAYSCADVLQAQGYNDAMVVGVDGNEETFRRIENGTMAATISQPFEEMANTASVIIEKIISGVSPEDAAGSHILYVDAPLVTKATLSN